MLDFDTGDHKSRNNSRTTVATNNVIYLRHERVVYVTSLLVDNESHTITNYFFLQVRNDSYYFVSYGLITIVINFVVYICVFDM